MNYETAARLLETELQTNWVDTEIGWRNFEFDQLATGTASFIRAEVIPNFSQHSAMGARPLHRSYGIFSVSIYSKFHTGTRSVLKLIDTLESLFKGKTFGTYPDIVRTRSSDVIPIQEHKGWNVVVHNTQFYFDE